MPKNKDLKRRVRARMRKTGESYTSARSRVVARRKQGARPPGEPALGPPARADELAAIAGMSDATVQAKTGKTWQQWTRALDGLGAAALPHRDIVALLDRDGVPGWWAQMITVGYERIRGLRDRGQRRGGGYEVNKSKTIAVPLSTLYAAFGPLSMLHWLDGARPKVKKATAEKTVRLLWEDGTPVEVYYVGKGKAKSQVTLQHRGLASRAEAERVRAYWGERLTALGAALDPGGRKPRAARP